VVTSGTIISYLRGKNGQCSKEVSICSKIKNAALAPLTKVKESEVRRLGITSDGNPSSPKGKDHL